MVMSIPHLSSCALSRLIDSKVSRSPLHTRHMNSDNEDAGWDLIHAWKAASVELLMQYRSLTRDTSDPFRGRIPPIWLCGVSFVKREADIEVLALVAANILQLN